MRARRRRQPRRRRTYMPRSSHMPPDDRPFLKVPPPAKAHRRGNQPLSSGSSGDRTDFLSAASEASGEAVVQKGAAHRDAWGEGAGALEAGKSGDGSIPHVVVSPSSPTGGKDGSPVGLVVSHKRRKTPAAGRLVAHSPLILQEARALPNLPRVPHRGPRRYI